MYVWKPHYNFEIWVFLLLFRCLNYFYVHLVPIEVISGHQLPRSFSFMCLWPIWWGAGSLARSTIAHNCWAISSGLHLVLACPSVNKLKEASWCRRTREFCPLPIARKKNSSKLCYLYSNKISWTLAFKILSLLICLTLKNKYKEFNKLDFERKWKSKDRFCLNTATTLQHPQGDLSTSPGCGPLVKDREV